MDTSNVRAVIFDVFGTVVDWRGSISAQAGAFGQARGIDADWDAFADTWRSKYGPYMNKVRTGELPWTNLDGLHRMSLEVVLDEFGITGLTEDDLREMTLFWHRLKPWADAVPGLYRLKSRYVISPMSNGNIAMMTNMAKNSGIPWDCVLGAEVARHYKPDPESYLTTVALLGLEPDQVVMAAAHARDLIAAGKLGLRTAYIPRPMEHRPNPSPEPVPPPEFDVTATDFVDLAAKMGA